MSKTKSQIKSETTNLFELLSAEKYLVPFYQRGYEWQKDEIGALLDDIEDRISASRPLFIGTISVVARESRNNGAELAIVDGQQRIVTYILILAKANEIYGSGGNTLLGRFFSREFPLEFESNETLEADMREIWAGRPPAKGSLSAVSKVVEDWIERLKRDGGINVLDFLSWVESQVICALVTHQMDSPGEIALFQSLNARGLPLESFDLIRSFIGMKLSSSPSAKRVIEEFDETFSGVHGGIAGLRNRKKDVSWKSDFESFLMQYIPFTTMKPMESFSSFVVYRNFVNSFSSRLHSWESFQTFLSDGSKYFAAYLQIKYRSPDEVGENGWFAAAGSSKSNFFPFAFTLLTRPDSGFRFNESLEQWVFERSRKTTARDFLRLVVGFYIKQQAVHGTGVSDISFWLEMSRMIKDNTCGIDRVRNQLSGNGKIGPYAKVGDSEFRAAFDRSMIDRPLEGVMLILTEHAYFKADNDERSVFKTKPTVEHIMPQNPIKWKIDSTSQEFRQHVGRLGNLCLLTKRLNTKIGNSPFDKKKELAYKNSDSPLVTGRAFGLRSLNDYEKFGYDEIDERNRILADLAVRILSIENPTATQ